VSYGSEIREYPIPASVDSVLLPRSNALMFAKVMIFEEVHSWALTSGAAVVTKPQARVLRLLGSQAYVY
jgi:hypothetical protein